MKRIRSSFVIGLMFSCILISLIPNISAGLFVNFSTDLRVYWNSTNTSEPIVPISGLRAYDLEIEYTVTGPPFGRYIIYPLFYEDRSIDIKLELFDKSDWAIVKIPIPTIHANIPAIGETKKYGASVQISLKEDAPAFESGFAAIKFTVPTKGHIQGFDQVLEISFKPGYRALIDVSPQISSKIIGPKDVAVFPINVTNHGNAITKVIFDIDKNSIPDNWFAEIDEDVIVEIGDNNKETVYLRVMPPQGLKKFVNNANIRIMITPAWAESTNIRGNTETLTLNVEVEPSSSNNKNEISIEIYLIIIGIIFLILIIIIFIRIKRRGSCMVEKDRKVIVDAIDLIISIFIIIAGIFLILFSLSWNGWIDGFSNLPDWMNNLTWIFFIVGLVTILFGIKRIFNYFLS